MTRSSAITGSVVLLLYMGWFTLLPVSIAAKLPSYGQPSESTGCCSQGCCCARAGSGVSHSCECCKKKGSCDCGLSSHDDAMKSILILQANALPRPARVHPATRAAALQTASAPQPADPDLIIPTPPPKPAFAG